MFVTYSCPKRKTRRKKTVRKKPRRKTDERHRQPAAPEEQKRQNQTH